MNDITGARSSGLVEWLEEATALSERVPASDLVETLDAYPDDGLTPTDWLKVVRFADDQCARWQVRWLFSDAVEPDLNAGSQLDQWSELWRLSVDALVKRVPEVRDEVVRSHELLAVRTALDHRLVTLRGKMIPRLQARFLSSLAIALDRLGAKGTGNRLYMISLFPAGSIGRAGENQPNAGRAGR